MKKAKRTFPVLSNKQLADRMDLKRKRLLLCLDEIRRWLSVAVPVSGRIHFEW